MDVVALDCETLPIVPGRLAPPIVCVSLCTLGGDVGLYDRRAAREAVTTVVQSDCLLVGHNFAFDMAVFCSEFPDLIPNIFDVYWCNQVACTEVREKLIHIAEGRYHFPVVNGERIRCDYSLKEVVKLRLGMDLDKTWQSDFYKLQDVPIDEWPEDAKLYSKGDAVVTLEVFLKQQAEVHYLDDQFRQSRAAFWLQLMACWGMRTDAQGVRDFASKTKQEYDQIVGELSHLGFLHLSKKTREVLVSKKTGMPRRNKKAVEERVVRAYTELGKKTPMTSGGQTGKPKPMTDYDTCKLSKDPVLIKYSDLSSLTKTLSTDIPLLRQAVEVPLKVRYEVLLETGRTSSSPNCQNLPTEIGVRECFVPRPGWVYAICDYSGIELRTWAQICLRIFRSSKMAEALNEGLDPHIEVARRILNGQGNPITYEEAVADYKRDPLGIVYKPRQSGKVCFHPATEVLTRLGWKKIELLAVSDEVCSAVLSDEGEVILEWGAPIAVTKRFFNGELVYVKNEGIDLRVTPDHRMCGWKRAVYRDGRIRDRVVTCLPEELGCLRYWPNAGRAPGELFVDERLLRLAVATQADGHYEESGRVRLGFTKERKIARLRSLLNEVEFKFKVVGSLQVSTFYLDAKLSSSIRSLLTDRKTLPWWWTSLQPELREIVLEEARFWDSSASSKRSGYTYSTVIQENVDVLQAIATITNHKTRSAIDLKQRPHLDGIRLSIKPKNRSRGGNLKIRREPYEGLVYCLTTKNDSVVVRHGGIPVITRQCNFGFPGGLGPSSFVDFARKNYDVIVDPDEAKNLHRFWKEAWPEQAPYFEWIGSMTNDPNPQIKQLCSNRYRGDVSFTEASNSLFQGLAADIAKAAGFLIFRACYAQPDSPLYGCRPVNFIHDEFVTEVPDDERAHDAAVEQARIMVQAAEPFLPEVPAVVEPMLCRRWSKKAKPVKDQNGRLVPWDFPGGRVPA